MALLPYSPQNINKKYFVLTSRTSGAVSVCVLNLFCHPTDNAICASAGQKKMRRENEISRLDLSPLYLSLGLACDVLLVCP